MVSFLQFGAAVMRGGLLSAVLIFAAGAAFAGEPEHAKMPSKSFVRPRVYEGQVMVREGDKLVVKKVTLPAFDRGWFRTRQVRFEKLPEKLEPDASGCFCYQPGDPRFDFVQILYFLDRDLRHANALIKGFDAKPPIDPLEDILVKVERQKKGFMPEAIADATAIDFLLDDGSVEASAIGHEVGHALQLAMMRMRAGVQADIFYKRVEFPAVFEGVANIFGALANDDPSIGKNWFKDAPVSVDRLETWPEPTTVEAVITRKARAREYSRAYPETVKDNLKNLEDPDYKSWRRSPDPYHASAAFTQPLWLAAKKFGRARVERVIVRALPATKDSMDVPGFAEELLRVTDDKDLKAFLDKAFRERRLLK